MASAKPSPFFLKEVRYLLKKRAIILGICSNCQHQVSKSGPFYPFIFFAWRLQRRGKASTRSLYFWSVELYLNRQLHSNIQIHGGKAVCRPKEYPNILYSVRRSVCGFFENAETSFPLGHTVSRGLKGIACSRGVEKMAIAWPSIVKWSLYAGSNFLPKRLLSLVYGLTRI